MNRRLKHSILLASAGLVVALGVAAGTAAYSSDFKLGQNIALMVNMMRGIFSGYVDPVDPDTLGKNAAMGMVSGLDPYTEFIHADDMPSFELMTTGKYGGIGSLIRQKGEYVVIAEPQKGSPARRAGLETGDAILAIDGKDARGMTTETVSSLLKGESGTTVELRIRKFYTGEEQRLTIRREVISMPAIPYYGMVSDSVGYIHHSEFTEGSADSLRSAFTELKKRGAKALVLDYRSNGGGIVGEAVGILSMFVPKGTKVLEMRGRGDENQAEYFTEHEPLDVHIPLAVLIDGYSASASEILAGGLQDLDRAVIVGQRSFGKGLVQSTLPLGYDSYLKITTAKYYTPSGRCIQAIDYSHQNEVEDASAPVKRIIPDSLIREFRTAGGRKVYDGGGIMPDVRIAPQTTSRFTYTVYAEGLLDDFADEWCLANRGREVPVGSFVLTDEDWQAFVEFMADKPLEYSSATKQTLEALRQSAEAEHYLSEDVKKLIDGIETSVKDDTASNLALHREELSSVIEDDIVLRRHHSQGVSEHNLRDDKCLVEAMTLLRDGARYDQILKSRDTDKK